MLPKLMDKFAMKDPSTAHCRVYLGNLPDDSIQEELYEMFNKHGNVRGILVNRGFGFIQFEDENGVTEAISNLHGNMYHGRNLIVRPAQANPDKAKQSNEVAKVNTPADIAKVVQDVEPDPYDQEPPVQETNDRDNRDNDRGGFNNNRNRNRGGGGIRGGRIMRGGMRDTGGNFRDRSPPQRDWNQRGFPVDRGFPVETFAPDRNDCEIIVVSKALTEYAEYIEDRLKRHGITVDLLFPKEDVPIGRVLGNIHSRGCLYAILIMPQNEEYRSLTLNILHGLPQEHRHMPLEDALTLISRNFAEYRSGSNSLSSREAMLALLGQLADGRSLTVLQYDRVIEYLKERREQQVKVELGNAAPSQLPSALSAGVGAAPDVGQNDLQQMILSMLNNDTSARPQNKPAEVVSDPTVQKALDSFLQKLV